MQKQINAWVLNTETVIILLPVYHQLRMQSSAVHLQPTVLRQQMVTLPGRKGAFQVLRNHAALVTSLSAGNITYRAEDGSESSIPVSGGFAQVRDNVVNVCIEG